VLPALRRVFTFMRLPPCRWPATAPLPPLSWTQPHFTWPALIRVFTFMTYSPVRVWMVMVTSLFYTITGQNTSCLKQ
jgi:hypothetical protein